MFLFNWGECCANSEKKRWNAKSNAIELQTGRRCQNSHLSIIANIKVIQKFKFKLLKFPFANLSQISKYLPQSVPHSPKGLNCKHIKAKTERQKGLSLLNLIAVKSFWLESTIIEMSILSLAVLIDANRIVLYSLNQKGLVSRMCETISLEIFECWDQSKSW